MTKTVTVHAQQMWEYRIVNRQTEATLLAELNEAGKAGWELVTASYNKDLKGITAWTAILKRPLAQPHAETHAPAAEAIPQSETKVENPAAKSLEGFDLSGDEFTFQMPEPLKRPNEPDKLP